MAADFTQATLTNRDLAVFARTIRIATARMIHRAKSSHIGSCFSMIDLLAVLYGRILRVDAQRPAWPGRDRFILSKGHACAALDAVLAEKGFFPKSWLDTFYQDGSALGGHAMHSVPGVEVSTGSLGHGLSLGCGMALVAKRESQQWRVFTLLSDGECDEGSVWEAVLFAGHQQLENLVVIVDHNKIQSLGRTSEILNLHPLAKKWRACRWAVREIDGHNLEEIESVLSLVPFERGHPSCVIAHTVKGKGVSFMENKVLWHYRSPDDEELRAALAELSAVS
ncbi:MAG TPA: transketolase [Candidatus Acidoferrales bacterium]|nr:transketolase [Candidatus Acidoferrales bacterium]